jgi:hypothetical protein
MTLQRVPLGELEIDDEPSFAHVGLYRDLRQVLLSSGVRFALLPSDGPSATWARALFLNLTFWSGDVDVLVDRHIPADVVTHVAWHHLARSALGAASADALFMGEAIASAFDLYLVGRLVGHADESAFLTTQVPAMADCAADAGLHDDDFADLLDAVCAQPERAFEDLRQLLFDVTTALVDVSGLDAAAARLAGFADHRFHPLLHHFEISNWILHARAHCPGRLAPDHRVRELDDALRRADASIDWLEHAWVGPAIAR